MLPMYKYYLSIQKKQVLDKYLGRNQYGDFTPLLYEIFQRRQYEFDLNKDEFEEEIKNFCKNVKKILFLGGDIAKDLMGNFQGAYFLNYPIIAINSDITLKFPNGEPEYYNLRDIFNVLTHEVHHAISHRSKTYGIESLNDRSAFGRCLNEIIVEMSSAKVCKDVTRKELAKTRQETNSYIEVTALGNLLISAFGVSEKEFLKAGMRSRDDLLRVLASKFPPEYKQNVSTFLAKYQTNLDILFNSLYHSKNNDKTLTESSLSKVFDISYEIARNQIQLDKSELTPQYISEINHRYNQMIQIQRENLMEHETEVAQNIYLNIEYMQHQKKYLQKVIFDLNKAYSIKNIVKDPIVFGLLTEYAKEGAIEKRRFNG